MAVLSALDLFDTVEVAIEANWFDVAPVAIRILEGDTGPAAMAAAVKALSAKNTSFFMMGLKNKVEKLPWAPVSSS